MCVFITGGTGLAGCIALDMNDGRNIAKEIRQLEKERKYLKQLKKREQLRDEVAKLKGTPTVTNVTNSSNSESQPGKHTTKG